MSDGKIVEAMLARIRMQAAGEVRDSLGHDTRGMYDPNVVLALLDIADKARIVAEGGYLVIHTEWRDLEDALARLDTPVSASPGESQGTTT